MKSGQSHLIVMKALQAFGSIFLIAISGCSAELPAEDTPVYEIYLRALEDPASFNSAARASVEKRWELSHTPLILEAHRFSRSYQLSADLLRPLIERAGQKFGQRPDLWRDWLWKQKYTPLPDYPEFKSQLYRQIDKRFAKYFSNDRSATIRLDEVRWGGVIQDGIPPLRQPKMIPPTQADYLGSGDIVFGIEVDGEARAYPKRILAWHEMFVDTIQGVPLAGVY